MITIKNIHEINTHFCVADSHSAIVLSGHRHG